MENVFQIKNCIASTCTVLFLYTAWILYKGFWSDCKYKRRVVQWEWILALFSCKTSTQVHNLNRKFRSHNSQSAPLKNAVWNNCGDVEFPPKEETNQLGAIFFFFCLLYFHSPVGWGLGEKQSLWAITPLYLSIFSCCRGSRLTRERVAIAERNFQQQQCRVLNKSVRRSPMGSRPLQL